MAINVDRWQWLETLAGECGPSSATTRQVLHGISLHMNAQGESAWPSFKTLAIRTSLSERSVSKHVTLARTAEWLKVTTRMGSGHGWRVNQYRATVPDHLKYRIPTKQKRQERRSVSSAQPTEPNDRSHGTSVQKPLNEVPTNSSLTNSINSEPASVSANAGSIRSFEDDLPPPAHRSIVDNLMLKGVEEIEKQKTTGNHPG